MPDPTTCPTPTHIELKRGSRVLQVRYADGRCDRLDWEYLRVYSPSAEVRGHGQSLPNLVPGKREVTLNAVEPVGQYAVRLVFSDGHRSGVYSWTVLRELADQYTQWWPLYLERMTQMGMSRDSEVVKLAALPRKYQPPKAP